MMKVKGIEPYGLNNVSYGTTNDHKYVYDELVDFISGNSNSPDKSLQMQLAAGGARRVSLTCMPTRTVSKNLYIHVTHSFLWDFPRNVNFRRVYNLIIGRKTPICIRLLGCYVNFILSKITVFENHRKNLIQHCERSELRLHFEWT